MKSPLPDKYFTKLYYQQYFQSINANSAGIVDFIMRGNSVYDPEDASGGRGCFGFDELAAIYNNYRVYASKITVTAKSGSDVSNVGDSIMLVVPDRSNSAYSMSTFVDRVGMPETRSRMLNRFTNGDSPTTISSFRKTKNIMGEDEIDDASYKGAVTGNPLLQWYWHVMFARADQSAISQSPSVIFSVKIVYYVEFSARKALVAPPPI